MKLVLKTILIFGLTHTCEVQKKTRGGSWARLFGLYRVQIPVFTSVF